MIIEDETRYVTLGLKIHICNMSILYLIFSIVHKFKLILFYSNCKNVDLYTVQTFSFFFRFIIIFWNRDISLFLIA